MSHYNHLIIGTGQATGTLLGKLIPTQEKIVVIEAKKVGGSCVNFGCTPTKTLVASAKAFYMAKRGEFYGFQSDNLSLNFERVRERMNSIRNGSSNGLEAWMKNTPNVDLIYGQAHFTKPKEIEVNGSRITADTIYINVGTRPFVPTIEGIDEVDWLDSGGLLDLEEVPKHLIVVGGGYIGVEFAQVFRRFGARVTIVQRGEQLMPREDHDVAMAVADFLKEEGIEILFNSTSLRASQKEDTKQLEISVEGITRTIEGDALLMAVGRIPNSDTLQLDTIGMQTNERGYIEVNDYCETNIPGVFALGDVNGHGGFTHTAVNDAEIALDRLFGGDRTLSMRTTVYGLFTDPPLGRVGLSEKEALKQGKKVLMATRPMSKISRAKEMGETKGFAKLLVDAETDLILGASILGVGGDEVINMFATIIHSKIPCRHYRKVVLVHPTVSELMPWILDGIQEAKQAMEDQGK